MASLKLSSQKNIRIGFALSAWGQILLLTLGIICLTGFTLPSATIQSNKSLIKTASDPTVYWLQNNKIYGVYASSLSTMQSNSMPGWSFITTVPSVAGYTRGPDFITTGAASYELLIKLNTNATVYVIHDGYREALSSTAFSQRGYSLNDVIDVPSAILNMFPLATDSMQYIGQNPADDTVFAPNTSFTMTWQLKNNGGTRWFNYDAFWVQSPSSGNPSENMTSPLRISAPIPYAAPNQTIPFSVSMMSPSSPGTHWMYWQLRSLDGNNFGIQFFIRIVVSAPTDAMQLVNKTPLDGTVFGTNAFFSTTWRLQNTGGTTWNSNYTALWIPTPVDGHESSNLTSPLRVGSGIPNAAPGAVVDLTITMAAPPDPGTYYMYWQLQNGNGVFFGPRFYVQIVATQAVDESFGSDDEDFGTSDSPGSNGGINDDSLNTATGNFNYRVTDLTVPGRGLDFVFGRSYNAKDPTGGPMGPGWSHSFNIYVAQSPSAEIVTVHYGDGKVLVYGLTSGNTYKPRAKGYYDILRKNGDGTWILLKQDQREFHFTFQGRLTHIRDRNGNQVTLFYGPDNNLARIVDTVGREFFFTYTNSLLTGITDPINRHLTFQYTGNKLVLFRDAKNNPNNYSYDGAGRLSEVFDGRGLRVMGNSYDAQGRLISQFNGRNFQWLIAYNDVAGTTTVTDPNQKQIVYSYDSGHKLRSFTNRLSQQNRVQIDYDPNNNRSSVNDPNSLTMNVYSYLYDDSNGYVKRSTDPDQKARNFIYDARNNPTHATDELNHTTVMGYDGNGNMISLTDALSGATSVSYNALGQPLSITDPNLNTTTLSYDVQGNLIRIENAEHHVTQYGYDAVGRRISLTDARGKITRFIYDENDNLTSVQRPIGTIAYTYDQADNLISFRDPAQNLTTFEYDANNNLVVERDATRVYYVQHTYDPLDRSISTRDKRSNTTMFEYDPEGRLLSVTDPELNKTSYTYDGNGNRLTIMDANNQITNFTYDNLNRPKIVRDPLGNTIMKEYDAAGRLISETDARSKITRYTYDETNNLIRVDDAEAGATRYIYDKNHNLREQIDPNTHKSRLIYDKANRLITSFDPLDNRYDYEYDGVGNRITQIDAKRQTIRFIYDDNNRLVTITYPNSTVQLTYDINGNLIQVVDPLGTINYGYDALNRVISYRDVYGKVIGYQYDPNGNVITLTYPDGKQVQYTYDKSNRMISLTDWSSRTVSYQYNKINLLTGIIPPSSTSNGATTYTYDLAGRLTGMLNAHPAGGNNTYAFTLDQNGNRVNATIQEPLNNTIANSTRNYSYDIANRIQTAGPATFSFDANGNMTSKTENGTTTNYTYDFNDRLTSDQTNTYFYNGQGVRLARSRSGSVTRYVVDINRELSQVLCETDGSGNITSYYIYGQGLVYKVLPNGTHYYYQFDPSGSTVSMTDDVDSYTNKYTYDPYGTVTNSAEIISNPFKFGGRFGLMDDGNGLVYIRARYYSPELGRFLTKDPINGELMNGQSLNRYIYALDNPIGMIDPDGKWSINWKDAYAKVAMWGAEKLTEEVLVSRNIEKIAAVVANNHGFDKVGKWASRIHRTTSFTVGSAFGILSEVAQIGGKPDMDWTERAARISLRISDAALSAIPASRGLSFIAGEAADASFDARFNALKKGVDKLYDKYGTTVDWTETRKIDEQLGKIRQQQREKSANRAATNKQPVKVMPRGPVATPVMPRGPKPAPITPRGPSKKK